MAIAFADIKTTFPNPKFMFINNHYYFDGTGGISFPNYNGYSVGFQKPTRRTEFESNIVSVRPKTGAVERWTYDMTWEKMPTTELDILRAHFSTYYASRFVFYPPEMMAFANPRAWAMADYQNNGVYCVYGEDTLNATMSGVNRWKVKLQLVQAERDIIG